MRSRSSHDDRVADLTRRRLEVLIAELEAARGAGHEPAGSPPGATATDSSPADLPWGPQGGASRGGAPVAEPSVGAAPAADAGAGPAAVVPGPVPSSDRDTEGAGRHAHRPLPSRARLAGWWADRLPPALRALPALGSAQVGLVAMVVAAGLVLGAWWLVQGRGTEVTPVAVRPPEPLTTGAPGSPATTTPGPASATAPAPTAPGAPVTGAGAAPATGTGTAPATAGAGAEIVVDVIGRVRRPGIAVLPAGSRVVDAVRAAGGLRPGFRASVVNLARPLADGEQVVIRRGTAPAGSPALAPPAGGPSPAGGSAGDGLVNINTADQQALESLPGVGPVIAAAILQWRTEHGGFSSVDELLEVSGIGEATLAEIAPHATL